MSGDSLSAQPSPHAIKAKSSCAYVWLFLTLFEADVEEGTQVGRN